MKIFKYPSLEYYLTFWLTAVALAFGVLGALLLFSIGWSEDRVAIVLLVWGAVAYILGTRFYLTVKGTFDRASLHVDALRVEDYNQFSKPMFPRGVVGAFHKETKELSLHLQGMKSQYDQHAFLVYQLIDQLATPVLVFNQDNKLSYANGAFTKLYNEPWQMYRYASPKLLNLKKTESGWQLKNGKQWQINHSEFIDSGETHQLLVFTNIGSAMRETQSSAWQQMIRVIGHEVNNSLTPVASLAEGLADRMDSERNKQALALISERCYHLQDFIQRYASVSKLSNLNRRSISVPPLVARLQGMFVDIQLDSDIRCETLLADESALEQVLINLIKNAIEAEANHINLLIEEQSSKFKIKVIDNGHGVANLDNMFVPLFTTKPDGQGIGLSFCRKIISQHGGEINLENNSSEGVTVTITLSKTMSDSKSD